jgi:hypothetical protein
LALVLDIGHWGATASQRSAVPRRQSM